MDEQVVNMQQARKRLRPQGNGAFCRLCIYELQALRKQVTIAEDDLPTVCDRLCVMRIERNEDCPSKRY